MRHTIAGSDIDMIILETDSEFLKFLQKIISFASEYFVEPVYDLVNSRGGGFNNTKTTSEKTEQTITEPLQYGGYVCSCCLYT